MRPHALALAVILATLPSMARAADPAAVARGAYLFNAADCVSCHTDKKNDGAPLAGGRPLATPFGTYYSPNITPDDATGIGKWTLDDFHRALRDGRDDDGDFLF
ncbi:MAG TPA: c-type cytochrome, partial [Stellaceae bacterium]|nr:c-type cytochrome [Stellaceae bacterium]